MYHLSKYNPKKPLHSPQGDFQYLQVPLKFGRLISYKHLPFKIINTFML